MRSWGLSLLLVLMFSTCVTTTPAHADEVIVGLHGTAVVPADGMPTLRDPWRTITAADFTTDALHGSWTGTATLGGPVPEGRMFAVLWKLGRQQSDGCTPVGYFPEYNPPVSADHTIRVSRSSTDPAVLATDLSCLVVTIRFDGPKDDPQTYGDTVSGPVHPLIRTSGVSARPASGRLRVAADRPTPVILLVTSHVESTDSVTVVGASAGRDAILRTTSTPAIGADRTRPVVATVRADRQGRFRMAITARDDRDSTAFDATWPVSARRVPDQRPVPGRYASRDGSVRFKVTRAHVRRLRVDGVPCVGSSSERAASLPTRVRLPRTGATARVFAVEGALGRAYVAAQLLARSPQRVVGTFTLAEADCVGSVRFSAVRQD